MQQDINKQNNDLAAEDQYEQKACEDCSFELACKLSQQILELRDTLEEYRNKNKEVESLIFVDPQQQMKSLDQFQKASLGKIQNIDEQEYIKELENQLQQLEKELQLGRNQEKILQQRTISLHKQFDDLLKTQFESEKQYSKLLQYLNGSVLRKQAELGSLKSLFQRTNFVNIIYSVSFQDDNSYLNGEKITPENSWKVIQILAFYQKKYPFYNPKIQICWDVMQLQPQKKQRKRKNSFNQIDDSNLTGPIQIRCDNENAILSTWMPLIVLEMKNLFEFMVKESGLMSKLKYEVNSKGEFQFMNDKTFETQKEKFKMVIKGLLNDINQINQLQFFAKESRIKQNEDQKK